MCGCNSLLGVLLWDVTDFSKKNNSCSSLSREQAAMEVEKFALHQLRVRP